MLDRSAKEIVERFKKALSQVGNLQPEDCITLLEIILEDYEVRKW